MLAFLIAVVAQVQEPATTASARIPLITEIPWLVAPRVEYPERALSNDVRWGEVVLDCTVGESGRLTACVVVSERPSQQGFGAAVVRGVASATVDSKRAGEHIIFRASFSMRVE